MARILLVDDDDNQVTMRRMIFEKSGHEAVVAHSLVHARRIFDLFQPHLVVLDLRLPSADDGCQLIREWTGRVKIVVLSGALHELDSRSEKSMVDVLMQKPVRSQSLLAAVSKLLLLLLLLICPSVADVIPFTLSASGEAVAELTLSSPGSDWALKGREAAVAEVRVDDRAPFHIMVTGARPSYSVFLGDLSAGAHRLTITRHDRFSAPDSPLTIGPARVRVIEPELATVLTHAPVLFARANTIGRFSDIPLFAYAERDGNRLTYTVIFSNEDGGTSTRALMARWGRTTDIEFVYRLDLDASGNGGNAIVQGRDHKDLPFEGKREGRHPLLIPVTDNNMVSGEAQSELRFQIAPILVDLSKASREVVMDANTWMYELATKELIRENKLRPFGQVQGSKISDPRNYAYLELKADVQTAGIFAGIRLKGADRWRFSHLGSEAMAIERSGWVRTTVELPPGTTPEQIEELGIGCIVVRGSDGRIAPDGSCELQELSEMFLLTPQFSRAQAGIRHRGAPVRIGAGEFYVLSPASHRIRQASAEPR